MPREWKAPCWPLPSPNTELPWLPDPGWPNTLGKALPLQWLRVRGGAATVSALKPLGRRRLDSKGNEELASKYSRLDRKSVV